MSAERIAELKAKKSLYENALDALATGQRTVKLSYEGNSVEYGQGDAALLKSLLARCETELAALTGARRGPFRLVTG